MNKKKMNLSAVFALIVLPALFGGAARADEAGNMAAFWLAIKGVEILSTKATADMWTALGAADEAQKTLGLAKDMEKGDLGGEAGLKAMMANSASLQNTIQEMESVGAPLTKEQKAAAQAAYLKMAGTTILWAGAIVAGKQVVDQQDSMLAKIAAGIIMAKVASDAASSTKGLLTAWKAYRQFNKGTKPLREPTKELLAANMALVNL